MDIMNGFQMQYSWVFFIYILSAWRFSHPKKKTKIDNRAGSDIFINE